MKDSLYDSQEYYAQDGKASRLSVVLNPLMGLFDWMKALDFISKSQVQPGAKVLDVGAGDGKFLAFLRKFGMKPFGTTASRTSQAAALQLYGINLSLCTSLIGDIQQQSYDAITYWHVFEHLDQAQTHVDAWYDLLVPNGIVMLEVPNIDSLGAKICYQSWLGSDDVHHINHMQAKDLIPMIKHGGFKLIRSQGFSPKFSYVYVWSSLLGFIFGQRRYSFNSILSLLKYPWRSTMDHPLLALNALASIIYLFPVIVLILSIGLWLGKGEVLRCYFQKINKENTDAGS